MEDAGGRGLEKGSTLRDAVICGRGELSAWRYWSLGIRAAESFFLIHGFESPWQIWEPYIGHYQSEFHVIVPILTGHNVNETEDFVSFERCAKELEDFCLQRFGDQVDAIYGMSMGGVLAGCI